VTLSVPYLSLVLEERTGLLASLCWLLHVFHAISEGCFRTCTTGVPKLRFCDRAPRLRPVKLRANFDGSARRVGLVGQSQHEPRYLAFCPLEFLPLALLSFVSSASCVCQRLFQCFTIHTTASSKNKLRVGPHRIPHKPVNVLCIVKIHL
jgi:hypothetical protein